MRLPWQFDQERWRREHRWDVLGRYNAEVSRGIVHTPECEAAMSREQAAFDAEHGRPGPMRWWVR